VFSLFRPRREGEAEVVSDESSFFRRYERRLPERSQFESRITDHAEADLRLVQAIESVLVPVLGHWEQTDRWFHQMDYYGDGVRSLVFRRDVFPREQVPQLQALLVGEHKDFTILCCIVDQLLKREPTGTSTQPDDYLAIWRDGFLVTNRLAASLSSDA